MENVRGEKGFTLIELLLVVVIIGLMLAVIVPRAWRANIDTKYGLVKQNCTELASFAQQWTETMIQAQSETATSTANDYFHSLVYNRDALGMWINWNANNNWATGASGYVTVTNRGVDPECHVEGMVPPDKTIRNPFNGVNIFEVSQNPEILGHPVTGTIGCSRVAEATGGWYYYALLFSGTDNTTYNDEGDTSYHAGQGCTSLQGLRNGVFLARVR